MRRIFCPLALVLLGACQADEGRAESLAGDAGRGWKLVRELGCASCHASVVAAEAAPRLEGVGGRRTPAALEAALAAGPRMPDCLAALGKRQRTAAEAELVHFLASLGGPLSQPAETLDALTIERGR